MAVIESRLIIFQRVMKILKQVLWSVTCTFHGTTAPTGPEPPHYRGFLITLSYTQHTR